MHSGNGELTAYVVSSSHRFSSRKFNRAPNSGDWITTALDSSDLSVNASPQATVGQFYSEFDSIFAKASAVLSKDSIPRFWRPEGVIRKRLWGDMKQAFRPRGLIATFSTWH